MLINEFMKNHTWDSRLTWLDTELLTNRIITIHGNAKTRPDVDENTLHSYVNNTVLINEIKYKPLLENIKKYGGYTWAETGKNSGKNSATTTTAGENSRTATTTNSTTNKTDYGKTDDTTFSQTDGGKDTQKDTGTVTNANDIFAYDSSSAQPETSATQTNNLSTENSYGKTINSTNKNTSGGSDTQTLTSTINDTDSGTSSSNSATSGENNGTYEKQGYTMRDILDISAAMIDVYDNLANEILRNIVSLVYTATPDFNLDW